MSKEQDIRANGIVEGTNIWRFFAHEDDYADLDEAACCERLGRVLSFATVSHMDASLTDWAPFEAMQAYLREAFPLVFASAEVTRIDHSLLLVLPGADPALKPVMFMGHQDVVPVVAGTEQDWAYGAYSGHVDGTFVWGRGAIDMKSQVAGELEAAEYALSHGWQLRRTLILAFGQDEETLQTGAAGLAAELERRGIELEFLVDEGDYRIVDAVEYGAPGLWLMHADLAEKGYADIELVARSAGGHSSNPFGGTSLAVLAEAITRIAHAGWEVRLTPLTRALLGELAEHVTQGPLAELGIASADELAARADEVAAACLADRQLSPLVTTTCAPTMIEGGSQAPNVMPQDMKATINFRMLEDTSVADVLARCRELVEDLPIEVRLAPGSSEAAGAKVVDGPGLAALRHVAARYFQVPASSGEGPSADAEPRAARNDQVEAETSTEPCGIDGAETPAHREPVRVVPSTVIGATDARNYAPVCPECLRFSAFVVDDAESDRGVHGTNERITRRAYLQGIRFLIRLIEETCAQA